MGGFAGMDAVSGGASGAGPAGGSAVSTGGSATGGTLGTGTGGSPTAGQPAMGGAGASTMGGAATGGQPTTGGSSGAGVGGVAGSGGASGMTGGDAGMAGGGAAGQAGAAGQGGSAGIGECGAEDPPQEMQETIDITWEEMTGELSGTTGARGSQRAIQNYPSWTLDHVMWSEGSLNFCVRWDSEEPVSETLRDQVADALQRGVDAWFEALYGYDCFPFSNITVNITGWATRNRATFQWDDDNFVPLFINQLARDNAPDCPDACSRNAHQQGSYQFPDCPGGFENHFDQEVWLTENYDSPNGWDFGQHVDRAGFTNRVTGALYHIWLHEFGHGIGFPDYYDWDSWAPGVDAPRCVMNAGAATTVTDWDKWMFKRTWSELRAMGRWN